MRKKKNVERRMSKERHSSEMRTEHGAEGIEVGSWNVECGKKVKESGMEYRVDDRKQRVGLKVGR